MRYFDARVIENRSLGGGYFVFRLGGCEPLARGCAGDDDTDVVVGASTQGRDAVRKGTDKTRRRHSIGGVSQCGKRTTPDEEVEWLVRATRRYLVSDEKTSHED